MSTAKIALSLEERLLAVTKRFDAVEKGAKALVGMKQRVEALEQRWAAIEAAAGVSATAAPSSTSNNTTTTTTKAAASSSAAAPVVDCSKLPNLMPCAQDTPVVAAVRKACIDLGLSTAQFKWVAGEYYSKPLQYRRDVLGAPSIHYLCKSIVLENTHCVNKDCSDPNNSRFYIVVFQYTEKFNAEEVMRFIKDKNEGLGKKKFGFRLANPEVSAELTGFGYNAVVPFGTKTPIPIILSQKITELQPAFFWMGGGHEDCKVRVDTEEFLRVLKPFVANFTVSLTEEELNSITE